MLTEIIDLPSKGKLYPKDHPLSSGQIEIRHMTARDEDVLTTQSYIENNIVMDKLLENIIVTEDVNVDDLTIGDKQQIILQTRILAYGPEYEFQYDGEQHTIDLSKLPFKGNPDEFDHNRFLELELKRSGKKIKVKALNQGESKKVTEELEALRKRGQNVGEITTRLVHIIEEVDGDTDKTKIREFVRNELLAADSLAIRLFLEAVVPDIDFTVEINGREVDIPIGINFLYPSAKI